MINGINFQVDSFNNEFERFILLKLLPPKVVRKYVGQSF